uniref:Shootin-1 n=1 Tax=Cyclopterus lumpus TaxID=8103 RepID=A0A8C2WRR5_CYCLU
GKQKYGALISMNDEVRSHRRMVIEEVNDIQQSLDIERTCRLSAEALASKLNRQNRSLKRKSMMLLPHLGPEVIAEVGLDEDDEEEEEEESEERHAASNVCLSPLCQPTKLQTVRDLEALREQLGGTREELLKEKLDNTALIAETVRQKKLLAKYNRVSQFAVEEFEVLQDTLKLERDLRTEAEGFARAMVVEQTKLKRESQILMESSSPSQALQEALGQVSRLTQDLETQRLEHQNQMKQMEDRLRSCEAQRELMALRRKLELMEEEKREHSDNCSKAKLEVKDLRFTVEELQQKLQAVTNPPPAPAPAPPPPPPPPPPAPAVASNPLSQGNLFYFDQKYVRQQAVDEMMHRIKKGVQLRPVGQSPSRTRRQVPSVLLVDGVSP